MQAAVLVSKYVWHLLSMLGNADNDFMTVTLQLNGQGNDILSGASGPNTANATPYTLLETFKSLQPWQNGTVHRLDSEICPDGRQPINLPNSLWQAEH